MKHQETFTDVLTKNFNYALEAIPRAFGTEKPKRKTAKRRKSTGTAKRKAKTLKAKTKRAVKKGAKKMKRAVKSAAKKTKRAVKARKPMMKKRANNVHKLPRRKSASVSHARAA